MPALISRIASGLLHDRGSVTALDYAIVSGALTSATLVVAHAMTSMLTTFVADLITTIG